MVQTPCGMWEGRLGRLFISLACWGGQDVTDPQQVRAGAAYEEHLFFVFGILARLRFVQDPSSNLWKDILHQALAAYPQFPMPLLVLAPPLQLLLSQIGI